MRIKFCECNTVFNMTENKASEENSTDQESRNIAAEIEDTLRDETVVIYFDIATNQIVLYSMYFLTTTYQCNNLYNKSVRE